MLYLYLTVILYSQKLMRILEALEAKGFRLPLTIGEVELAEKLVTIIRQVGVPFKVSSTIFLDVFGLN